MAATCHSEWVITVILAMKVTAMKRKERRKRQRPTNLRRTLREVLQDLLTPALWKQAEQQRKKTRRKKSSRWTTQPLVLVLLLMTWCSGDSQAERFEVAKAYCQVTWMAKRRAPGKSVIGFQKALTQLPLAVLRTFARGVLLQLERRLAALWTYQGFVPVGCDGSRLTCPRAAELEKRLGCANKENTAPSLWVTALVHLRWGLPLAWRFGKSNADERGHLRLLVNGLPKMALVVADAGYVGYPITKYLADRGVKFLLRMCCNAKLYTAEQTVLKNFREGIVYYWPSKKDAEAGALPLELRLIRIRARRRKDDVWLLTNVLSEQLLPLSLAGQMYRWRWQSEGCFRNYKHTLKKVTLVSRTVRQVHREAEGSWLALQLLLAQGALAQQKRAEQRVQAAAQKHVETGAAGEHQPETRLYSPRKILIAIRHEMLSQHRRGEQTYGERLARAFDEDRPRRTSAKAKRKWPRRKPHKPPKPPQLLKLTNDQKTLLATIKREVA